MSDVSSLVNRDDLKKALRTLTGREDVHLVGDYRVERASSGVEGFTSITLRVCVSYRLTGDDETKSHVFFVKTMSQFDYQRNLTKVSKAFSKEWLFFNEVVPVMNKVSAGRVGIPLPIFYHGVHDDDNGTFYMEDLVDSSLRPASRSYLSNGLDYAHCSMVMKGLGRLHALALAADKSLEPGKGGWAGCHPDFDRDYVYYEPRPGDPPPPMQNMVDSMILNFKELCREVEGLPKEAESSGALEKVMEGAWPTYCRLKKTPTHNRRVLTHGDCWMNNMMFKYEKDENGVEDPVDVKFFDLQLAKVCHPSIDLLYFLFLNTTRPLRDKFFSDLIDEYHESFTESLKLLDGSSPPYSLNELKSDLMGEYKPYGILVSILFSPIMMLGDEFLLPNVEDMTAEKIEDFFNTGSADRIKFRFLHDAKYRSNVEETMREFVDMALPNGFDSVNSSPLLVESVN